MNSADLIVVADVKEVRDLGAAQPIQFRNQLLPGEAYSADLLVRRTLKGSALDEITVTYSLPQSFVGYNGLSPGIRTIFLRRDGNEYHLANPYYPSFPATLETSSEKVPSDDPQQLVLSNMLAVLGSSATSSSQKYEILGVDYALPLNHVTVAALRKALSTSPDRELTERLLGELIRFGDLSQLPAVADLLLKNSGSQNGREWLLYVIGNRVKDARAIPVLKTLLGSSDDSVREAGTQALWRIADPAASPALVHMLDDPDEKARFYAVRGLSDIANEYGWGGPTELEFNEHPQKYLTHWREWAKNRAP